MSSLKFSKMSKSSSSQPIRAVKALQMKTSTQNKRQRVKPNYHCSVHTSSADHSNKPALALTESDVQKLLSQFECPVCLDHISPPILQCLNGHILCKDCSERMSPKTCPTCREYMPTKDNRNHQMERMAITLGLLFPCKHRELGCRVTSLLTEMATHDKCCPYDKVQICQGLHPGCTWLGTVDQLVQHLIYDHKLLIIFGNRFAQKVDLNDPTRMTNSEQYIIKYANHYFIWCYNLTNESSNIYFKFYLLFIGEQKDANKFLYKYEMENQLNGSRTVFEARPVSIGQKVTFNSCNGLVFDLVTAKQFSSSNCNELIISLRIIQN